ncbi:hypothetical protein WKR98_13435 [Pigmentiphaga sp. YJ18]|uniref:hypothetical protein n=1 Tax=Pigmentiphaga sp. YJ18 TaxID=3134907 RepID=UPI0031186C8B
MIRSITIRFDSERNTYQVEEGGRLCPELTWEEMLGQLVEITHPRLGTGRFSMLTPEEHDARRARMVNQARGTDEGVVNAEFRA